MYSKLKKYVTACCAFFLVSFIMSDAKAAVASEEVNESTESTEVINPNTIDLDVPSYLVRYLYREPDADEINIKHWYDGWGWMLYWNPDVLGFGSSAYRNGFDNFLDHRLSVKGIGLALSKDFNKISGIRLGANYSSVNAADKDGAENELQRVNISLDYIWNLSSTYYGYDTHRTDEWLLTAGIKGGKLLNEGDLFGSVNLGLQYRKNIANDMSFFVEPQFAFFSDQYDNNRTFNEVDPGLNLLVGLYFRMGQPKMDIYRENHRLVDNLFFQALGGVVNGSKVTTFKSPNLSQNDYQRHGMNFGFNVGGWFNPSLGIRTGYFENIVGHANNELLANQGLVPTAAETYRGGRLELLINPITILTNKPSIARFGLDFSVGYEAGVLNKHNEKYNNTWTPSGPEGNHINYFASGITFASQLKYYLSPNYAFFAEGRFSNPMYSVKSSDGLVGQPGTISDRLMSWAVGMEYYTSAFERYTRFSRWDNHQSREIERLDNDNRWYVELAGGLSIPNHNGENFNARRGMAASASLGMYANDYSGFRLRAGAVRKYLIRRPQGWQGIKNQGLDYQTSIALDYTLNLTNLWWGVDATDTRWSDLYLFAGPMLQIDPHEFRTSFKGHAGYGFEVGTQLTRRITPGVELFAEPRYEWQMHAADRWNFLAGLKLYQYKEKNYHYRDSLANHDKRSFFMEVAGGFGSDVTGTLGMMKQHVHRPDWDARLGFGYRINPISSVRASVTYTQFGKPKNTIPMRYNLNGTRTPEFSMDYMANLLNLWYGNNPHRLFQLQAYVGALVNPDRMLSPDCTTDIAYTWKLGLQGGAQLLYTPFNNVGFFVEPRLSYYLSDYLTRSGAEYGKYKRDEHFDLFAGLIIYNQPEILPKRGYNTTKVDSARTWYYEMAVGGAFTPAGRIGNNNKSIAPTGYIGIGHYMNNLSSMRLRLGLVNVLNPENVGYKDKFVTSLSLDYMYNLTNRAMGVNPYRRFDFSLYGGPTFEFHNSQISKNDVWDKGINLGGQLSWHLNNYLDIFGETRAIMSMAHHSRYEALLGAKLYQNTEKSQQFRDSAAQHAYTWFMEVAGGAGKSLTGEQKKLDGTGKIAVGYRFNPISSVRMGNAIWSRTENGLHYNRAEFSLDYMANLFNIWYGVNPYRRVNLRGFVGPTLTVDYFTSTAKNLKLNAAYSAGIQTTVGLTENIDFLLEPRFVGVLSGDEKNHLDGYVGLIFYNQPGMMEVNGYNTVDTNDERGMFVEVGGGVSFAPDGRKVGIMNHIDPIFNLALGRNFGKYSAVRVRGGLGYVRNVTSNKTNKANPRWIPEASLDYIHNVTNHFLGINPYRRFDMSLYAGPMVEVAGVLKGVPAASFAVNGGAQVAWHANNFVDIFVEPRVNYFIKEDYYSRFETLAGIRLYKNNTNNVQYDGSEAKHANTWFMETALGAGTLLAHQNKPDFDAKVAVGYRYNPVSSLRLSGAFGHGNGNNRLEVIADYMANIQNILYGVNPERRFNLRGFVGGIVSPENYLSNQDDLKWSLGFNAGLQATYAISDNVDLMVEPRVAKFVKGTGIRTPRGDVYAGLIFYNNRGLAGERGWDPTDIEDKNTWFVEAAGGASFASRARIDDGISNHIDKDIQVALGVHLNNYSSLRGRFNLTLVQDYKKTNEKSKGLISEYGLDYMFNLTNAMMGVNPYRRFDLNIFAGPELRSKRLTNFSDVKAGLNIGSQLAWHINDKWDLFGEGRVDLFKDYANRVALLGGLAYRFNKNSLNDASFDLIDSDRMYAQVLAGAQIFDIEKLKFNSIKGYSSAPSINVNLGYRFNKMVGMQMGLYSDHASMDIKKEQADVYTYGVRLEAVAGIMNMFNPSYDPKESRFNWTASLGVETGRNKYEERKAEYNTGLTAATQLQYRVFSNSWALFELRSQALRAKPHMAIPVAAQLGVMYDFNKFDNISTSASKWYVQGGAGLYESKTGMMQFALGVDATPVHGFRVSFDKSFDEVDASGELMSISPDYVFNLSNAIFGHDDDKRHVDFSLLLGGDFQLYDKDGSAKNSFNVNAGAQVGFNINKNWQIYAEPRFSFSPESDKVGELKHDGLNLQTTVGLKYHLPDFKRK